VRNPVGPLRQQLVRDRGHDRPDYRVGGQVVTSRGKKLARIGVEVQARSGHRNYVHLRNLSTRCSTGTKFLRSRGPASAAHCGSPEAARTADPCITLGVLICRCQRASSLPAPVTARNPRSVQLAARAGMPEDVADERFDDWRDF
jgi:hypothetical protein